MSTELSQRGYIPNHDLVSTDWVAEHLNDPNVRIIETNEDPLVYPSGHIPGAVEVDWTRDLNDQLRRDYLNKEGFEQLMGKVGITPEMTVVFYGDKFNWWATYALWVFSLFGHTNAKIMDGGRQKWAAEGRPLTKDVPHVTPTTYQAQERDDATNRAFRQNVLEHLFKKEKLIDVRSPEEYRGERLHMPEYPNEGALRGGHLPGAKSIPWAKAVNAETGEFKTAEELKDIYVQQNAIEPQDDIVVYCRIGERSSHTWFVLTRLLGYPKVRNYDGSWTEWGNLVGAPIEK